MTSNLEHLLEQQLQFHDNDVTTEQSAEGAAPPAAPEYVSYIRRLDFAPHNVQARMCLKENDATFRELDELEKTGSY